MLPPDDRVVLRNILRPPLDTELDLAIGTTFTLDLNSAVVVPLAFASHELSGSDDPIAVLESVRAAADKVHVFAQAGQLIIPAQRSDLVAFLEPMVHEVTPPKPGYLFHPKVWVLRFRHDDGGSSYRLVCGTRNLTDDSSWDAVISLDGVVEHSRTQTSNRPLADFVRALPRLTVRDMEAGKADAITALADELLSVTWEHPDGAREIEFHALGVGARRAAARVEAALEGRRGVVVSPFLDDATIEWFRQSVPDLQVLSRAEALEALDPGTVDGLACRVLHPLAGIDGVDDDPTTSGTATPAKGLLGGLHAKLYAVERGAQARMLIGSSNATSAGLDNLNVEFLVELQGHRRDFGVQALLGDDADFATIFSHYEPTGGAEPDQTEEIGRNLEGLLRRVAAVPLTAHVARNGDTWTEAVTSRRPFEVDADIRLTIGLLTVAGRAVEQHNGPAHATFALGSIADITPFVCIRASQKVGTATVERGTVVRANLIGDPADRFDEILARQFDTTEKFLRFIMLLLSLRDGPPLMPEPGDGSGPGWDWSGAAGSIGLFESIIRAVAEQPKAIDDLDRLVNRLQRTERGAAVLPAGFGEFWKRVTEARRRMEAMS